MTTFDKREAGFEAQFAHEDEMRFKALARRNKGLGAWAAALMGMTGPEAQAYAASLLAPDLLSDDGRVIAKVAADLQAKGIERSGQDIVSTMGNLLAGAIGDIQAGR